MKILFDENIPFGMEAFGTLGDAHAFAGRSLTAEDVRDAEVLLVRSVTRVDADLLKNSRVRFIGSATIGTDHIDRDYLDAQSIAFAHAPGSNADSVVEYILAAVLGMAIARGEALRGKTFGIVGCGNIGSRLALRLPALGFEVLQNDPPLAERAEAEGRPHNFVSLDTVLINADLITMHVPLTHDSPHATHHLINKAVLQQMKPATWLLNSSRGPVVSNSALSTTLRDQNLGGAVLDVWENEPTPATELLALTDFATPHIAGYSFDGKVQGTVMLYEALCAHLQISPSWNPEAVLAPAPEDQLELTPPDPDMPETPWLHHLVQQMYDLSADDAALREVLEIPSEDRGAYFTSLRKHYPRRRTFARFTLPKAEVPDDLLEAVTIGLGLQLL